MLKVEKKKNCLRVFFPKVQYLACEYSPKFLTFWEEVRDDLFRGTCYFMDTKLCNPHIHFWDFKCFPCPPSILQNPSPCTLTTSSPPHPAPCIAKWLQRVINVTSNNPHRPAIKTTFPAHCTLQYTENAHICLVRGIRVKSVLWLQASHLWSLLLFLIIWWAVRDNKVISGAFPDHSLNLKYLS